MKKALDPAGHLGLSVGNFAESEKFYSRLFSQIGFKKIVSKPKSAAWVTREGFGIWIRQALCSNGYSPCVPGLQHLCFKSETKAGVDALYKFLRAQKASVYGPPRLIPEYLPHYYALYFPDPNGIKLEYAYY